MDLKSEGFGCCLHINGLWKLLSPKNMKTTRKLKTELTGGAIFAGLVEEKPAKETKKGRSWVPGGSKRV